MAIEIRPIETLSGCADIQRVHQTIWGNADDEVIPTHVLITWATNECVLLGAYDTERRDDAHGMVGFALGWYGVYGQPARLKYCSHIVGVLPEYQGREIGLKLKLAQRETLIRHAQTDVMTWTYDPLQIVNGSFNIHRLGGVSVTYKRDVYGEMTDQLNAGAPSDRLQVDWMLTSARVQSHVQMQYPTWDAARIEWPVAVIDNLPHSAVATRWQGSPVAIPLPEQLAMLRTHDKPRLLAWRQMQREYFEAGFAAGYQVVDCVNFSGRGWHYLLTPVP
jgi:predicted GNAT superfamily acetyltransferase